MVKSKIILVISLSVLILIALFVFISTSATPSPQDLHFCSSNADCIIVEGKDCCACPVSINKKFSEYWASLEPTVCSNPAPWCPACLPKELLYAVCENNYCVGVGE